MARTEITQKITGNRLLRTYVGVPFIRANRALWERLPENVAKNRLARSYGDFLRSLTSVRDDEQRRQNPWTCFLRNRAELDYIKGIVAAMPARTSVIIAVLGCSSGAEAYSIAWALRDAASHRSIEIRASDIDPDLVAFARQGRYGTAGDQSHIVSGLSGSERYELFTASDHPDLSVRDELRLMVRFSVQDATAPDLVSCVGRCDVVVANRFLCHMDRPQAEACLGNLIGLVKPGGHLLVSGVDLDVRSTVTRDAGLIPVPEAIEPLHGGDPTLLRGWPFEYWGLEPIDRGRPDWMHRYGTAFRKPAS